MTTAQKVYDFVVIGGGIVGLATAMELLNRKPGASLLVIEKESQVAFHQTGHNSGVIHAGIYYTPGSLKAVLCKKGAERTREFADEHGIPYRNVGKLIVATNEVELERMEALYERAVTNGMDVEKLDGQELKRREPRINGIGAIWSPNTGIIDYTQVCQKMAEVIEAAGGQVRLGTKVVDITESFSEVRVDVAAAHAKNTAGDVERVFGKQLVVCGGIQADRLARMAGLNPSFHMVPFRGEYYRLPASKNTIVNSLIYPVPDPGLPFLGVHLTLMMDGGVTVGPNAVMGFAREGYPHWSMNVKDIADFALYKGFWKLVPSVLKTGLVEMKNSAFKPGYLKLVTKYAPELRVSDLGPEPAGIRAQAVMEDGSMAEDFLFMETDRMVHVCNAPSPAATSSMPIAEMIVDKVMARA
ncbi:L-2-hydroxyglutarate oxidase LhgO [Dermatophilus congolensis]|uniref:L-2-hydroxyglutarate oxidase LhgO n=1 Tax=Dermatophilus congolensis TaxID=1863 RepID=A0AA46GZH2_9MICO|nr:L-2-hydroxyglutarate oxidase [Dermatophilus congolensis]STD03184.1 L-2-hydroxyglutarate oxidase LhgO [Dermatophilus congolensis]